MTATADLKSILNDYLRHIVYLDDQFQIFWRRETVTAIEMKRPPRVTINKKKEVNSSNTGNTSPFEGKDLYNFCMAAQKDFSDLTITPLIYEERFDKDKDESAEIIEKLKTAKFVIIDGFLSDNVHALDVIEQMKDSQELKLVVVYTAQKTETINKFESANYNLQDEKYINEKGEEKKYNYAITEDFILMICEKHSFDFRDIIDSYIDLFLTHYGHFPVAFIEVVNRIEKNSSKYLSTFSKPFDSLMLLQSSSEGLPQEDMHTALNSIIVNQIKQDMRISDSIITGIYDQEFCLLESGIQNEGFEQLLHECIDEIALKVGKCSNKSEIVKALKRVSTDQYVHLIRILIGEKVNFGNKVSWVCNEIKKLYVDACIEEIQNEKFYQDLPNRIKIDIKRARKNDLEGLHSLIPLFILVLANKMRNSSYSLDIYSMLSVLKTYKYPEEQNKFEDIFCECYEGESLKDEASTMNKLFSGDIYFDKSNTNDVYLCVTPSCHLFRPKKVNNTVLFIKGTYGEKYPSRELKDSEHLTFLPEPNGNNKICIVKWNFHDIKQVDLKRKDEHVFENWYRPYRMLDDYHKQIMSEFNSFYSKVGVEEFFAKPSKLLTNILLHETE